MAVKRNRSLHSCPSDDDFVQLFISFFVFCFLFFVFLMFDSLEMRLLTLFN